MKPEERERRALELIKRGEAELAEGKEGALATFEQGRELAPDSPLVLFWEGLAWLKFGGEGREQALIRAKERLTEAVELDESLPCIWKALGCASVALGESYQELELFQEAFTAFQKGSELTPADLDLWAEWGKALTLCGLVSEEAIDYRNALGKFERAEGLGAGGCPFWIAYGNAYRALADLIADKTLLLRAISCFERGAGEIEGQLAMAETLAYLYVAQGGVLNFDRAYVAFVCAASMAPADGAVQLAWSQLLVRGGTLQKRPALLQEALEKLAAAEMASADPLQCGLAKTLTFTQLGRLTDQLANLYEAQNLGEEVMGRFPSEPLPYVRLAQTLVALGDYFAEAPFAEEALSHFQEALTLDPACYEAHIGFGQLLVEIGTSSEERSLLEQAAICAREAVSSPPHAADAHHIWGIALAKLAEIRNRSLLARQATDHFEQAIVLRGGPDCCDVDWLFHYGCSLDLLGTFHEDEEIHYRAIQILEHVLTQMADETSARFQLAMAYVHYGEFACDPEAFEKALIHFKQTTQDQPDEEVVWDEWGCTLLAYARLVDDPAHLEEADNLRDQAREKFSMAVKLGSGEALYHLSWLYADIGEHETATTFLEKAALKGALPPRDELLEEEWLGSLRHTEAFREFLDKI